MAGVRLDGEEDARDAPQEPGGHKDDDVTRHRHQSRREYPRTRTELERHRHRGGEQEPIPGGSLTGERWEHHEHTEGQFTPEPPQTRHGTDLRQRHGDRERRAQEPNCADQVLVARDRLRPCPDRRGQNEKVEMPTVRNPMKLLTPSEVLSSRPKISK